MNATFAALADPTRRAILSRLAAGEATVNELAQPFATTQSAVSKHLKVPLMTFLSSEIQTLHGDRPRDSRRARLQRPVLASLGEPAA